jgi:hypothetical protein
MIGGESLRRELNRDSTPGAPHHATVCLAEFNTGGYLLAVVNVKLKGSVGNAKNQNDVTTALSIRK